MNWLTRVFRRERLERELDAEVSFHIEQQVRDLTASGVNPRDARRRVLAEFGGVEPIKEAARDARGTRWLEDLLHDLRYAFRSMRRNPGFTLAAVLSLAIGIGANTAIFSVVNALLVRPLPVIKPSELYYFNHRGYELPDMRFSFPAFQQFRERLAPTPLAAMTSSVRMQVMTGTQPAELVLGQLVTGNWFDVVGVNAAAGRLLTDADNRTLDGHPIVVLSHAFWTRRFGADPGIVNSIIRVNGQAMTVVGVAAAGFSGFMVGEPTDLWAPTMMQFSLKDLNNASINDADGDKPWSPQDGVSWLTIVARVGPSETAAALTARVDGLYRAELEKRAAGYSAATKAYALRDHIELIVGARGISDVRDEFGRAVLVLMATVALVLIVACANLANLLLARSESRGREFAIRLSLGAGRGRLIRQLLTESVALALIGGFMGLAVARGGGLMLLRAASSGPAPIALDVDVDWTLVAFAIGLSIATGMLFGLLPALRFSRPRFHDAMKSGARIVGRQARPGRVPAGRLLVVAQVAVSLLLLVGAGLFIRTLHNLLTINTGFDTDQVIVARFDPRAAGYTGSGMASLRRRLTDAASVIPGAEGVGQAACGIATNCHRVSDIEVPGRTRGTGADNDIQEDTVDPGFLPAVGMTFTSGRNFNDADTGSSQDVAIVTEAMARHFFGTDQVVGRTFSYNPKEPLTIVGVLRDARINGLRSVPPRMVYVPFAQRVEDLPRTLYVRASGGAVERVSQMLAPAISGVDRNLAIREIVTQGALAARSVARERLVSGLTGIFGVLAVAVACLGLYGALWYSVVRRTNEIGIRLALGASLGGVRWLVLRETLMLVCAGMVIGLLVTLPSVRVLASLLYGLSPQDPATLAGASFVILAVSMFAGAVPAWRAARLDPVRALRAE